MRLPLLALVVALAAAAKEKEAAPPRVYRELHAHHKTGVWYTRDVSNISCSLFGYDGDACWRHGQAATWAKRCRLTARDKAHCGAVPPGAPRRRVAFFREPYATVVSGYLYHHGGGGGVEKWTTTPLIFVPKSDPHYKMLEGLKASTGPRSGHALLLNDSFSSYLRRIPIAVGLRVQMDWDARWELEPVTADFERCADAADCAVECLEWHGGEDNISARWDALARFAAYGKYERIRLVQALPVLIGLKKHEDRHVAHASSKTARKDVDFLVDVVAKFDAQFYRGRFASRPWRDLCRAPAPPGLAKFPHRFRPPPPPPPPPPPATPLCAKRGCRASPRRPRNSTRRRPGPCGRARSGARRRPRRRRRTSPRRRPCPGARA